TNCGPSAANRGCRRFRSPDATSVIATPRVASRLRSHLAPVPPARLAPGMTDAPQTLSLTPAQALDFLAELARDLLARRPGRVALGLAGGPGVGKSTLATQLVERLNAGRPGLAAYVPMDGFHMR